LITSLGYTKHEKNNKHNENSCENTHCRLSCSCDLDLDPMTFIYEPGPYSLEIHRMCKCELLTSRQVIV